MPAPKKNQFAKKAESEKLSAQIFVNVTKEEKAEMVKAAKGERLSAWARRVLLKHIEK